MIKTNIKMRVNQEQSESIQKICFDNKIKWARHKAYEIKNTEYPYLFIGGRESLMHVSKDIRYFEYFIKYEEVDADLFIKTNGTCDKELYEKLSFTHSLMEREQMHISNFEITGE